MSAVFPSFVTLFAHRHTICNTRRH